ncbi:MAG: hypothetical protein WA839_05105 [Flavobacteriaceae bacterium]
MKKYLTLLFTLTLMASCKKEESEPSPVIDSSHIEYFGFTLIDTYWDDPTDSISKINYSDEVHSFSNLADILVVSPSDYIVDRITAMANFDMKAVLHLNEIFFENVGTASPSGADYDLRSDYQQRWDDFVSYNSLNSNQSNILTFYLGEEPTWNGISYIEFSTASDYVKNQFPEVPILLIEAYPIIDSLQVPTSVDWLGFDHYFVKDPTSDASFQQEWKTIKSKRSTTNQKLVVIMDSHYISWAHGDFGNIQLNDMKDVALNYYELALSETSTIAVIGYYWPNSFEFPEAVGARGMPQIVKDEYIRIGKEITGKK